jgi:hypothetical protein
MNIMRKNHTILLAIATIFFTAGIWSGCTVGFDPGDESQSGLFPCETNDDCVDGFECSEDNLCEQVCVGCDESPPCDQEADPEGDIDLDNDGYGTGDDRTNCPEANRPFVDCDDNDPDVNPGQPELCDGKDNNCDGEGADGANQVDEFNCDPNGDVGVECGSPPSHLASFLQYECRQNTCTLLPFNRKEELRCDEMYITCNSSEKAFTYELDGTTYTPDDVPSECR